MPLPRLRRTCRAASLAAALALTTGCYHYAPATVGDLAAGQVVRLDLSAVAVDRLRKGPADDAKALEGFQVNGKVNRFAGDSLVITWENSILDANARAATVTRDLALLRSDVQGAMLRRLDKKRTTWASIALGTAIAASATVAIVRGGRSSGIIPGGGSPPEVRIPFSFTWFGR